MIIIPELNRFFTLEDFSCRLWRRRRRHSNAIIFLLVVYSMPSSTVISPKRKLMPSTTVVTLCLSSTMMEWLIASSCSYVCVPSLMVASEI